MINLNQKTYLQVTGLLLTVGAVVHLLRALMGWDVVLAGQIIPAWVSWIGLVVAGYLAYSAYKLMK